MVYVDRVGERSDAAEAADLMSRSSRNLLALVGIAVLAMLFWDTRPLWPVRMLVVLFHELGHALAALATGGEVLSISLSPDEGGVTHSRGGLRFFILSAGYTGSLAFGVLWLALARTPRSARHGVSALAAGLTLATLVWVRPLTSFGFLFCLLASAAAVGISRWANAIASQWILRGLGVISVLYAVWDIRDDVLDRHLASSDASQLAELTFIPGPVWGVLWIGLGIGTLVLLRKWLI